MVRLALSFSLQPLKASICSQRKKSFGINLKHSLPPSLHPFLPLSPQLLIFSKQLGILSLSPYMILAIAP